MSLQSLTICCKGHLCILCGAQRELAVTHTAGIAHSLQLAGSVGHTVGGGKIHHGTAAQRSSVQEQLHLLRGGVHIHRSRLSLKTGPCPTGKVILEHPRRFAGGLTVVFHSQHCQIGCLPQTVNDLPQIADGASVAQQIQISNVGGAFRVNAAEVGTAIVMEDAAAGLAQIIVASPCEVAIDARTSRCATAARYLPGKVWCPALPCGGAVHAPAHGVQ